jgi:predicted 2-oxoglutarate/Fe(II)-dependent dioxygenase YbiX
MVLTSEQVATLRQRLEQSEAMHHRIMAKMTDPNFALIDAWEQKERIDQEIGRLIRAATTG